MPRTNLPPTPAPSTDIAGKDGSPLSNNEQSFHLPPPAMHSQPQNTVQQTQRQLQPAASPNFSLPLPPTRSRTIIQMKPKAQQSQDSAKLLASQTSKGSGKKGTSGTNSSATGNKQPTSTSVAGKKIARKTAHSVIERRRRSKMNEEFGVLKAMIPACTDQDMHKLAILQASIDYLRYLENCITELKSANNSLSTPLVQAQPSPIRSNSKNDDDNVSEEEEDSDEDLPMTDPLPPPTNPTFSIKTHASAYTSPQSISNSPSLDPAHPSRTPSYASSIATLPSPAFGPQQPPQHQQQNRPQSHHSTNTMPSPAFGPQPHSSRPQSHRSNGSTMHLSASTSPTIMPSKEQDQEATAALLMLNKDRRNPAGRRGMSVKDLLSC